MTLWFERIGLAQVLWVLLTHAWRGRVLLCAPQVNGRARWLVALLAHLCGSRVALQQRGLDLGRSDDDGRALAYRREMLMLALSQEFADLPGPIPVGMSQDDLARLLGSYVITKCREAISFVVMVEAERQDSGGRMYCYVAFPALGGFLAKALRGQVSPKLRVVSWPSLRGMIEILRFLPGSPRQWGAFFRPFDPEKAQVDSAAHRRGVVLEEAYSRSLSHYPTSGHMYWVESSGLDPSQVVLYCDRSDTPCDDRLRRVAADKGFGWIDGADFFRHHPAPRRAVMAGLRFSIGMLAGMPSTVRLMRWSLATACLIRMECLGAMLRRHNVVALHHFIEFSPEGIALCLAARRHEVLLFWNVWSVISFLLARYRWAMADLILAWGPLDRDFHRACGFAHRAVAEVGMIDADAPADIDDAESAAIRGRFADSVHFVVAAFDTSFGPMVHNSETHYRTFMDTVIGLVERHDDWGLLLKPKKGQSGGDDLDRRLDALIAQKRCVALEPTSPAGIAALAANAVVGLPINSAVEVGALRGRPALHLDMTGMIDCPLFDSGRSAGLVYTDPLSFARALEAVAEGRAGEILDRATDWAGMIDRFADGRGRWRAGAIIGDFVRAREVSTLTEALDVALRHYANQVGADRVVRAEDVIDSLWQPLQVLPKSGEFG